MNSESRKTLKEHLKTVREGYIKAHCEFLEKLMLTTSIEVALKMAQIYAPPQFSECEEEFSLIIKNVLGELSQHACGIWKTPEGKELYERIINFLEVLKND